MKKLLFIITVLSLFTVGALAGGPPANSPETAAEKRSLDQGLKEGAGAKIFMHPETGEILTHRQWLDLGGEEQKPDTHSLPGDRAGKKESFPEVLQGKRVELENGDYVIVVDMPRSHGVHTRMRLDKDGTPQIECDH